jgi:hypothetical protein
MNSGRVFSYVTGGWSLVIACIFGLLPIQFVLAEDKNDAGNAKASSIKHPIIVMQQEVIQGRVFLITEEEGEKQVLSHLKIQLYTSDGRKRLHKTATDKDGAFTLPNVEKGDYLLKVGLLVVDLKIENQPEKSEKKSNIPKIITIFIPKELQDLESE